MPGACRRSRALTATLLSCFDRWGYTPVATPALEPYDLLARGLSDEDRRRCIRFVAPPDGQLLALRADVTPQIARMLAHRIGGSLPADAVYRVAYAVDVVRHREGPTDRAEVHQVGVELVGDGDAAADAELVALCDEGLRAVGLTGHRIEISHTGVAAAVLDELGLPEGLRTDVRTLLAHKDRDGVLALLASHPAGPRVASLCDRFGPPATLTAAAAELPIAAAAIERLLAIADAVAGQSDTALSVDLGEVRGADYYTGLRLRAWAPGSSRPIVRGGRYDDLLARYGVALPATGFAIDLDALEAALAHAGVPDPAHGSGSAHLVAVIDREPAARARAFAVASRVRARGETAWVQPVTDAARALALAERFGAERVTLVATGAVRRFVARTGDWAECTPDGPDGPDPGDL